MLRKRWGVLLAVPALLAVSCGSGTSEQAARALVAAAAGTREADSARLEFDLVAEIGGQSYSMRGEGIVSFSDDRGSLSFEMPPGVEGLPATSFEMIHEGDVIYMRLDGFSQFPGASTEWVRVDQRALGEAPSGGFGLGGPQQDLTQMLDWLRGVSDDVEIVGQEEVRGEPTTHFRGTVLVARMLEEMPEEEREAARRSVDDLGVTEFPMDVWIDDRNLLRRVAVVFETLGSAATGGRAGTFEMTMDLYDFGVDVDVESPPADEVTDIAEVGSP